MKINKEDIKKDIIAIKKKINKIPTFKDYQKHGQYGLTTVKRRFGRWNIALKETLGETNINDRGYSVSTLCTNCKITIDKKQSEIKTNNFCSRSCANKFNNKTPKRKLTKKCKVKNCNNLIRSDRTYCKTCFKNGKHLQNGKRICDQTLREAAKSNDANRYNIVRQHARNIMKNKKQICHICKYDKHVHTCHIKDIPLFDLDTKIKEINQRDNLVLLCPNCHWELHHGFIIL